MHWLVLGFSGVSCSGKTTQANMLQKYLIDPENQALFSPNISIKLVKLISQDDYFLPIDHPNHIWIKQLNHINWDIITALDMDRMCMEVKNTIGKDYTLHTKESIEMFYHDHNHHQKHHQQSTIPNELNILIIEGFLIYNHPAIAELCQLKFHLHLPYEICLARRSIRTYEPADVPGYFEYCIWPMYQQYFKDYIDQENVIMLNGEIKIEKCFNYILNCIKNVL